MVGKPCRSRFTPHLISNASHGHCLWKMDITQYTLLMSVRGAFWERAECINSRHWDFDNNLDHVCSARRWLPWQLQQHGARTRGLLTRQICTGGRRRKRRTQSIRWVVCYRRQRSHQLFVNRRASNQSLAAVFLGPGDISQQIISSPPSVSDCMISVYDWANEWAIGPEDA